MAKTRKELLEYIDKVGVAAVPSEMPAAYAELVKAGLAEVTGTYKYRVKLKIKHIVLTDTGRLQLRRLTRSER